MCRLSFPCIHISLRSICLGQYLEKKHGLLNRILPNWCNSLNSHCSITICPLKCFDKPFEKTTMEFSHEQLYTQTNDSPKTMKISIESSKQLADTKVTSMFMPPENVRGMTQLDRAAFSSDVLVPAIVVSQDITEWVLKYLRKELLHLLQFKPVITPTTDISKRTILLNPELVKSLKDVEVIINADDSSKSDISKFDFHYETVSIKYENWKAENVLRAVLPLDMDGSQSYSRVGHIAQLNLREHLLPFKHLIGQVLLDKTPGLTLIVNKTDMIQTKFRSFPMEVLAGEGGTVATVREQGCIFKLDLATVYWNPRLATERERVIKVLNKRDVLFDVMAGVGPFAIPAGKKKCSVFANDLNPDSYQYLLENCTLNKTKEVQCYNLDGIEFIRTVVRRELLTVWQDLYFQGSIHAVMNLPAIAVDFLPAFVGLFKPGEINGNPNLPLPIMHVYTFTKDPDPRTVIEIVLAKLGLNKFAEQETCEYLQSKMTTCSDGKPVFSGIIEGVTEVRRVAPNKVMMEVTIRIPLKVLTRENLIGESANSDHDISATKRQKIDNTITCT